MMNYLEPIKAVAGFVVSSGVGSIVGQALRNTIPEDANRIKKVVMGVGALALGSYASHKVSEFVDAQIDEANTNIRKALKIDVEDPLTEEERIRYDELYHKTTMTPEEEAALQELHDKIRGVSSDG